MTTADDTFTPDWPHGHEMVDAIGAVHRFNVKAIDWPGPFPIVGHLQNESYVWKFTADGMREARSGSSLRLRNAPAPRKLYIVVNLSAHDGCHSTSKAYQKRRDAENLIGNNAKSYTIIEIPHPEDAP